MQKELGLLDAIPCQMHVFALVLKDVYKLPWALTFIKKARDIEMAFNLDGKLPFVDASATVTNFRATI